MFRITIAAARRKTLLKTHIVPTRATFIHTSNFTSAPTANLRRAFHTSNPNRVPLLPISVFLTFLKTGKVLQLFTASAKVSLTLLPLAKGRPHLYKRLLLITGGALTFVLALGVDHAPNTDRWRLIYHNVTEEKEVMDQALNEVIGPMRSLVLLPDHPTTLWIKQVVEDISVAAIDDVRDPIRAFTPEGAAAAKKYNIYVVDDHSTLNAACAGDNILVYCLLLKLFSYDPDMIAFTLAHEISHSIQQHSMESLSFGETLTTAEAAVRGLIWTVLRSFGPFLTQAITDGWSAFTSLGQGTAYNRPLEREADLIGLKIMAKAGYDPTKAVLMWERMASLEEGLVARIQTEEVRTVEVIGRIITEEVEKLSRGGAEIPEKVEEPDQTGGLVGSMYAWFGSSHPPSRQRVAYLRENLEEAIKVYEETLKFNGRAKGAEVALTKMDLQAIADGVGVLTMRELAAKVTAKQKIN
ncbi:hypothetical protein BC938DRAFT_473226 [Jimgerdemannia flammicorona]|uniref:Peptidase M48 domain-containing protein n=1 Tax=Jimgerdemannia flammicorona TaxID=994334 RepID=A0A433QTF8_9FUNG|nr:hypothetical protein BC938DRAFT_473226 [Jimgerdemannia flammicorona]